MNPTFRTLLALAWMACLCACSTPLPSPHGIPNPLEPVIPEFSGGSKEPDIAEKKTALVEEYQKLAQDEAQLDRERVTLMTSEVGSTFGGPFRSTTRAAQRAFLAKTNASIGRRHLKIEQLRGELTHAGVVITTHR